MTINTNNDILDVAITEEEIICAVRCLKNGKASGEDEIINEHIKTTVDILLPFYITMFNKIFDTWIIPDTWLNGVILPIYINKGDPSLPENYRPITILSCLGKLFTSVINNRLTKFVESNNLLSENQAGFRKGYSVTDHLFTLHSVIDYLRYRKKKQFIDFSKAFDQVWRSGLWFIW